MKYEHEGMGAYKMRYRYDGYDEYRGKKITIPLEQYRMLCDLANYSENLVDEIAHIYDDCVSTGFEWCQRCNTCGCRYDTSTGLSFCAASKLADLLDLLCLPNKNDEEITG